MFYNSDETKLIVVEYNGNSNLMQYVLNSTGDVSQGFSDRLDFKLDVTALHGFFTNMDEYLVLISNAHDSTVRQYSYNPDASPLEFSELDSSNLELDGSYSVSFDIHIDDSINAVIVNDTFNNLLEVSDAVKLAIETHTSASSLKITQNGVLLTILAAEDRTATIRGQSKNVLLDVDTIVELK